jgi:WD40 repeat protein
MDTGALLSDTGYHVGDVNVVAFSPKDRTLLSAASDGVACMWRYDDEEILRTFNGHSCAIIGGLFAPDGRTVLTLSAGSTLRKWCTTTGAQLQSINVGVKPFCGSFWPHGDVLCIGDTHGQVRLWDLTSAVCMATFVGVDGRVLSCALSPDGTEMMANSQSAVLLWRTPLHVACWLNRRNTMLLLVTLGRRRGRIRLPGELWDLLFQEFLT